MRKKSSKILAAALSCALVVACFGLAACNQNQESNQNAAGDKGAAAVTTNEEGPFSFTSPSTAEIKAECTLVKKDALTVVTYPDYEPSIFYKGNAVTGLDANVIEEVAKRIGLKVNYVEQPFSEIIADVAAGKKYDCAIGALSITDARSESVQFSMPYAESNLAIVVMKDSGITSTDQLAAAGIGAQKNSTCQDWAKATFPGAAYTPFEDVSDAIGSLRLGKMQAVVMDEAEAKAQLKHEDNVDCTILQVVPTAEQFGIAVNKENAGLTTAINEALKAMQEDGTLDTMKAKWAAMVE